MKNLFIYDHKRCILIPLENSEVYLVDASAAGDDTLNTIAQGIRVLKEKHKGYRIDNYNMTNLFFGD
jgi:hypothetical protein